MSKIKNLQKAADRIKKAIKNKERIIIYGDSDLDGITSTLILEESIKSLSGEVTKIYFADWETDDYGLNLKALKVLNKYSPALLCLLDCGIGNFKEIKQAKKDGFDIVVVDHHEILKNKVPREALVVDPKQPGDNHSFKKLSATAITYDLSMLLLGNQSTGLTKSFAELAALGTIADMMPEEGTNEFVIASGTSSILFTERTGLKAAIDVATEKGDSARVIFQKLVSSLNISGVKNNLAGSYNLLAEKDYNKAKELAIELVSAASQRSHEIYDTVGDISDQVERSTLPLIFEGSVGIMQALTGSVASRLCNKHKKPTFIYKIKEDKSKGSVRTPKDLDAVEALRFCEKHLEMYGGHPPAAGFTVKNNDIDNLKTCLIKYFNSI